MLKEFRDFLIRGNVIDLAIGVVMFFAWIGMALGAWQGGLFYDLCGNYFSSFANASLAGVANLLVLALLYVYTRTGRRKRKRGQSNFSLRPLPGTEP